jgi:hypothetical protein
VPGMRGVAGSDADRRQPSQDCGGALNGRDAVAVWPDVDGDALGAVGAGAHEVVGGPTLAGGGEVVCPAAQVLPRPIGVADHVGKAPQPLDGEAQLSGAQQVLACVPGVLLPLLLGQGVEARHGQGVHRSVIINGVGKQAELAASVLEERVSIGLDASDGDLPQQRNGAGHLSSQLLTWDAGAQARRSLCRACKREREGLRAKKGHVLAPASEASRRNRSPAI